MAASRWLLLTAIWSAPAVVACLSDRYASGPSIVGVGPGVGLAESLVAHGLWWYFWIPLTPLLLAAASRMARRDGVIRTDVARHIALAPALSFAHAAAVALVYHLVLDPPLVGPSYRATATDLLVGHLHVDLLTYAGILAAGLAIAYHRRFHDGLANVETLETKLSRAQLEALKMQLHPHFLFNTLHALGVLVRKNDTKSALRMLIGLSDLLRVTLDSAGKQVVSLRQELDFLRRYLRVERIRFGDRLEVDMQVDDDVLDARVPHLVLQPLLENAIRHGIAPRDDDGNILLEARRVDGDRLRIEVLDDGVGLAEDSAELSGMGLANVRARLDQLYGDASHFEISDRQDAVGVVAVIEIPLSFKAEGTVHE